MTHLSVVIPCFNEQDAIDVVLARFENFKLEAAQAGLGRVELIVVDDGSTDDSRKLLQRHPNVRTIENSGPHGYGAALKAGFKAAQGKFVAFYDMDATYDAMDILTLMPHLQGDTPAMVCGDRLSLITDMPLTRKVGNLLFRTVVRLLFRRTVYDCCTGLRVFHSKLTPLFSEHTPDQLNFSLAMTLLCLRHGIFLKEIPIRYAARLGKSKLKIFIDGPRFLGTILRHRLFIPKKYSVPEVSLTGNLQEEA